MVGFPWLIPLEKHEKIAIAAVWAADAESYIDKAVKQRGYRTLGSEIVFYCSCWLHHSKVKTRQDQRSKQPPIP